MMDIFTQIRFSFTMDIFTYRRLFPVEREAAYSVERDDGRLLLLLI